MFFKKNKKIICIGSSSKDIFFPTSQGIVFNTPEDLTAQKKIAFELGAKFQVKERFEALGGCAANVASGLARLGIDVDCYTKIGNDATGQWIEKQFKKAGVGTKIIQKQDGCKSDLSSIIVDVDTAERVIFSDRAANEKLEIISKKLLDAEWFFVSSLNGAWQKHLDEILEIAKKNNVKIAFNPGQKNIATDSESVIKFVSNCKLLVVNKDEALEIVQNIKKNATSQDLNDEKFLLGALIETGCKMVVITDGIRGAWAQSDGEIFHAQVLLIKALDTTGSGDAFTSGFFGAILKGLAVRDALGWGIINSRSVVGCYGGQEGLLNEKEINIDILKVVTVEMN